MASQPEQYILRMFSSGVAYFLLRVTHDRSCRCMKPVWWPERMDGVSRPKVFKSLATARQAQERYVTAGARSEIKEWSQPDG